jgi:S1-C subfamily serine protease
MRPPRQLARALVPTLLVAASALGCQPAPSGEPAARATAPPTPAASTTATAAPAPTTAPVTRVATPAPSAESAVRRGGERLQRGDPAGALEDFSRALALNPTLAAAHTGRGRARAKLGDKHGALEDFDRALALDPSSAEAHWSRGETRFELGDKVAAIEDFSRALALNPSYAEAAWSRGAARSALGDHRGALEDYNRSLSLNPNQPTVYWNRGIERYELGDARGALEDYTRAIQLDPAYANAYWNRGVLRFNLGDRDGGLQDLQYASKLFFDQGNLPYYYWALDGIRAAQESSAALSRSASLTQPAAASVLLEDAAALVKRYTVHVRSNLASGSGVSVGGGRVLTSYHVVAGAERLLTRFADGQEAPGTVVRVDAARDLALLQTDVADAPAAPLADARGLRAAERLLAVGYARTDVLDLQDPSVTSGIFSGLRQIEGVWHVQTDTPTNPGNSGGPLADSQGRLVGIVRGNIRDAVGINVAVASSEIESFLQSAGPRG